MSKHNTSVLIVHNHPIHYKSMLFDALRNLRRDFEILYVAGTSKLRNKQIDLTAETYPYTVATDRAFEDLGANLAVGKVLSTIIRKKPRIVVSCGYHHLTFWVAAVAAKLYGATTILWYESNEFDHKRVAWKEALKRIFMKMCDFAQVYGTSNKQYLQKLGIPEDRLSIKMAVVDVQRFRSVEAGIGTRPRRTLIYVGRFSEEKNLLNLLKALRTVNEADPDRAIFLRMVGYGPQERKLRSAVQEQGLEKDVEFCGPKSQDELKLVFAEGDALILPSTTEPWGLTILEAMCAGLPVIASDRCGCTADVIRPDSGWQFQAHSLEGLCTVLEKFQRANTTELKRMGTEARKIAITYSAENSAGRASALFDKILAD